MPTTRISESDHKVLQALSAQTGKGHQEIIDEALSTYQREALLDGINAGYAKLKTDQSEWAIERGSVNCGNTPSRMALTLSPSRSNSSSTKLQAKEIKRERSELHQIARRLERVLCSICRPIPRNSPLATPLVKDQMQFVMLVNRCSSIAKLIEQRLDVVVPGSIDMEVTGSI